MTPEPKTPALSSRQILDIRVDATSYEDATGRILNWARRGESRYVCVAVVHTVMESHDSPEFRRMVNAADLVTPDGMPLVWGLRMQGCPGASRVYGPDLTLHVLREAAGEGIAVGFYGSSDEILPQLLARMKELFPGLRVTYSYCPPFRALTPEEDSRVIEEIARSEARILFVGLGCPKQERWMAEHHGRIRAAMIGVGAAFDFLAGAKPQAPRWMQDRGLEWLFRLMTEPRRLWRRYLLNNPRFVALFLGQLLRRRVAR
jgi:N-acetylglucosaminyldiphosphoundecaprenol N-acetyl-beta-D-mannosaminyltransferase